jgi:hypothetical protein
MKQNVICIIHYNTPELTLACIRSLLKTTPNVNVLLFDNSDRKSFHVPLEMNGAIEVIDNTRGDVINFDEWLDTFDNKSPTNNSYASAKHCYTVQWLIDHRKRPFVLMDSDVLVKHDITEIFDDKYVYVGEEKLHKSRFGNLMRVLPYLCYVNVPLVKSYGITFYNRQKMFALSMEYPAAAYDTGCWFYEDCHRRAAPVRNICFDKYALHFGHGSWKEKDATPWLEQNKTLWK